MLTPAGGHLVHIRCFYLVSHKGSGVIVIETMLFDLFSVGIHMLQFMPCITCVYHSLLCIDAHAFDITVDDVGGKYYILSTPIVNWWILCFCSSRLVTPAVPNNLEAPIIAATRTCNWMDKIGAFIFGMIVCSSQWIVVVAPDWCRFTVTIRQFDDLGHDCSNSSTLAVELLQSYAKPSNCFLKCMLFSILNKYVLNYV